MRPRVSATLEVESGINDPFAIFLTIVLVEILLVGNKPWLEIAMLLAKETILGGLIGYAGGRAVVFVLNRLDLPQGLHAPFVATGALVIFGLAQAEHGSGFLAVYIAGLVVGNSAIRAHNTGRRFPRCRDLARADRDVRAARPAVVARTACRRRSCRRSRWPRR